MCKLILLGTLLFCAGCSDSSLFDLTLGDVNEDRSSTTTTTTDSQNDNSTKSESQGGYK